MTATSDLATLPAADPEAPIRFPVVPYERAGEFCGAYFKESVRASNSIDLAEIDRAARILLKAYTRGASVFSCGNGGSAAIANHLQCDHLKGVRTETDLLPRVASLSNNVELMTAIANDIGYEDIFAYQLQSQSRPGDVLVAISSSGRSANIVRALAWAREHDLRTIALTGFDGGHAKDMADVVIHVDCANYGVVEDMHQAAMHAMAQYIRQTRMTPDAIRTNTF
jgi:phosphoheptose isomerase